LLKLRSVSRGEAHAPGMFVLRGKRISLIVVKKSASKAGEQPRYRVFLSTPATDGGPVASGRSIPPYIDTLEKPLVQ